MKLLMMMAIEATNTLMTNDEEDLIHLTDSSLYAVICDGLLEIEDLDFNVSLGVHGRLVVNNRSTWYGNPPTQFICFSCQLFHLLQNQ